MKNLLFSVVFLISVSAMANPSRVYLLDGFFVHLSVPSFNEATEILKEHVETNYPGAIFTAIHNSFWRSVCDEIATEKPDRVVIIGHSYGGNAAMDISRCLEDKKMSVDMVIALDDFQKFFAGPADVVPFNVNACFNFYEDQDIALRGIQSVHRPDESFTNVTNTHVHVEAPGSPHYGIVTDLVNGGVVQGLIDQVLK